MPIELITTVDDERLADYRQLRDVKARRAIEGDRLFIAEGPVAIERLVESDHAVRSILVTTARLDRMTAMLDRASELAADDLTVFVVDRDLMADIVGFDLHRGAIAAAERRPTPSVNSLVARSHRIVVVEGLNDPENVGLIMRSASALNADAMILDPTAFDPYTRRSVRVSMGEALHLPFARATSADWPDATFAALARHGVETWAMTPADDAVDIWDLDVPSRVALVFGAEGPGLSRSAQHAADRRVRLAVRADVDSLNVAAAAAAALAIVDRPVPR